MKLTALAPLAAAVALLSAGAQAETSVKFGLDWKFEGPSAPFFVALDKGYYKAEGLDVQIDSGKGSVDGINRVASGTYPIGSADINSLIKFRDKNPDKAVAAVMMYYYAPPFAIATLTGSGITGPKGLEGKILGAPAADGAYAQWQSFVKANGIDASKVQIQNIGFPVREPMLAAGKVDAITGFSFSMFLNLKAKGVPGDKIRIMLMSDHGLDLYGNALMVNPDYAKANPAVVKGFVKATIRGFQDTIANPDAAIKHVTAHNKIADEAVELERLKMAVTQNIVTPWVRKNGLGDIDMARFAKSIDQIADTYQFTNRPKAGDVFTNAYLPPKSERMVK
jgi:NitT/TauT family transport system substrate-binding protein